MDKNRNFFIIFWTIFLCYLLLSTGLIFVQKPNGDEAVLTNVSINFINHGFMGVTSGRNIYNFKDYETHFYWQPPLSIYLRGIWFKIFGIGLLQTRFLGLIFGVLGLISWYIILKKLNLHQKSILLVLLIIALDYIYTRLSVDGRLLDIISSAFTFFSWAVYLSTREKNFKISLFLSSSFVVLSCLTHVNGIIGLFGLLLLIFIFDKNRFGFSNILYFIFPYLIGLFGWGYYILQNPSAFISQFFGNIHVIKQTFFSLIYKEIFNRYLVAYGFSSDFPIYSRLLAIILLLYICSYIFIAIKYFQNKQKIYQVIFLLTTITQAYLFILPHKFTVHLCFIIPLFAVCVGLTYDELSKYKFSRIFLIFIFLSILLSCGVNFYRFKKNDYLKYKKDAIEIKKYCLKPGIFIIGPMELGFELGFDKIFDDASLGYKIKQKNIRADFIITNEIYRRFFQYYSLYQQEIDVYVKNVFKKYFLLYKGKIYELYGRQE